MSPAPGQGPGDALWGWNAEFAGRVEAPTLIVHGDTDTTVPELRDRELYEDLGTQQKVYVQIACASHQLHWENRHTILFRASAEWLRFGTFAGRSTGMLRVDAAGVARER